MESQLDSIVSDGLMPADFADLEAGRSLANEVLRNSGISKRKYSLKYKLLEAMVLVKGTNILILLNTAQLTLI